MNEIAWSQLLLALGFVATTTILNLSIWIGLGWVLGKTRMPRPWLFRTSFILWSSALIASRVLLDDRSMSVGGWFLGVGVLVVLLAPQHRQSRGWSLANTALQLTAVAAITGYSLLGRVPDYSFGLDHALWLYGTSALAALVVYAGAVRIPLALVVALPLFLAVGFIPVFFEKKEDKPNVLFVLVDTLRRDHVGFYEDLVSSEPMKKLAEQGVTYQDAVTVIPKTTSSVASIFTGRYPIHHGVRSLYAKLGEAQPTLAEVFFSKGYRTAAFVNNAWLSRGRGFAQGFERFNGFYEVERAYGPFRYSPWVALFDSLTFQDIKPFSGQTSARRLTDETLKYLANVGDKPFFAYVHYFEPHWPYFPPPKLAEKYGAPANGDCLVNRAGGGGVDRGLMIFQNFLPDKENETARQLYRGEVDDTLAEIGRLLEGLEELGLEKDTIVVFTADHGHALGEHDYHFHHGEFLYEPSTSIPLLIKWPSKLPENHRVQGQVRTIDLAPTLYALTENNVDFPMDGVDISSFAINGDEPNLSAFLESDVKMFPANIKRALSGIPGKLRAIRTNTHKLILNPTHKGAVFELYDLENDPEELVNLADLPEHADTLERLKRTIAEHIPPIEGKMMFSMGSVFRLGKTPPSNIAKPPPSSPSPSAPPSEQPPGLNEAEVEMLKKLGYIQ